MLSKSNVIILMLLNVIIAVNTTSARVADLKKDKMERLDGV